MAKLAEASEAMANAFTALEVECDLRGSERSWAIRERAKKGIK